MEADMEITVRERAAHMISVGTLLMRYASVHPNWTDCDVLEAIDMGALLPEYVQLMIQNGVGGERAEDLIELFYATTPAVDRDDIAQARTWLAEIGELNVVIKCSTNSAGEDCDDLENKTGGHDCIALAVPPHKPYADLIQFLLNNASEFLKFEGANCLVHLQEPGAEAYFNVPEQYERG